MAESGAKECWKPFLKRFLAKNWLLPRRNRCCCWQEKAEVELLHDADLQAEIVSAYNSISKSGSSRLARAVTSSSYKDRQ